MGQGATRYGMCALGREKLLPDQDLEGHHGEDGERRHYRHQVARRLPPRNMRRFPLSRFVLYVPQLTDA
jgi:hypothetical protein